jgi:peptidoglycan hydrolase CwlO-like protein
MSWTDSVVVGDQDDKAKIAELERSVEELEAKIESMREEIREEAERSNE